jgi:hypothetical protein
LCRREIEGNVNTQKIITCGWCIQILLTASKENKAVYRDKLILEGNIEKARAIESFIPPEGEVIHEASRTFRRVVVRKRPMRAIRIKTRERRSFGCRQLLGQRWAEMR